jgi:hypothetical protein
MSPSLPALLRRHWFVVALLAFFAALSVKYSFKVSDNRSAILRWYTQLERLDDGEDIAARYQYPNPPIMAAILYPLTKLPPVAAALAWYYLKALTVLLSLRPVMGDLEHGNVNLFILFLVAAGLTAYRLGRDFLAGLFVALATACKVTPLLFLPYFVWKRSWRTVAGFAAGLALFLWPGPVPGLLLGFEQNQRLVTSWFNGMVRPFVVEGKVWSDHNNQSLPGLVARLLTHEPSFSTYVNDVYTPTAYHNVLALEPRVARWLVKGCLGLFALAVVWCCRTPTAQRQGWRPAAEFGLVLLGMLLFSERTWKHHCVTLVVPFAVLSYRLAAVSWRGGLGHYLAGSLAAAALLMATTSNGLLPAAAAKLAQVYGAYVLAYLVLAAALIVALRRGDEPAVAAGEYRAAA